MAIEKKLNRGEWFEFPSLKATAAQGVVSIGVEERTIGDSAKHAGGLTKGRVRATAAGANAAKAHRNYVWLPWAAGAVNYAEAQGKDVMSGAFSGCYMIRYHEGNGAWRVAHVSLGEGVDSRAEWNALAAQAGVHISHGFKPYDIGRDQATHEVLKGKTFRFIGLITNTGECWHFMVGAEPWDMDLGGPRPYRQILYKKKLPSLPEATLRHIA
jgi:hypothetical protein